LAYEAPLRLYKFIPQDSSCDVSRTKISHQGVWGAYIDVEAKAHCNLDLLVRELRDMGADAIFIQFIGWQGNHPDLIKSGINVPVFLLGIDHVGFSAMVKKEFDSLVKNNGNHKFISIYLQLNEVKKFFQNFFLKF